MNKGKKCDHLSGENSTNFTTYQIIDPSGNAFVIKTRQKVVEFCIVCQVWLSLFGKIV